MVHDGRQCGLTECLRKNTLAARNNIKAKMKGTMTLNLCFHKKLIEALRARAEAENVSVNALDEDFLDDGLRTVAVGDGYFQLVADPDTTAR